MAKHFIIDDLEFGQIQNIGNKLEDFEILQTLGKGGYGFVSKVKSRIDHKLYAMKMIDFNLIKDQTEINLSLNEIKIIQNLNSPHIIKYYNNFTINNRLYIIMEFMNNGDLKGYINAHQNMNNPIPENELWELFYQSLAGLTYIHKSNLIHRDIKPANLFMTDDKAIKIGDFGISASKNQNKNGNSKETLMIGTPAYMSPEMFNKSGYGNKIDVYALGVTFHVMCFYEPPRKFDEIMGPQGKYMGIVDVPPKNNLNIYTKEVNYLIQWMIERDPKKRPTSFEAFNYVKKIYNMKKKQNYSIDNVYRCLFSFQNLTNYMKKNQQHINQNLAKMPISNSFLYAIGNMDNNTWINDLANLREILTFENSTFPDPGLIDAKDLINFILKRIHKETIINKTINADNPYIITLDNVPSTYNYQQALQYYLSIFSKYTSCISDLFFGTYEITKSCINCRNKKYYFQNFFLITFDIDEALKNGLSGNNGSLLNYFQKQNLLTINTNSFCGFCKNNTYHQETKKFFTLPYNLIICFKGEKQSYDNQYVQYPINLNLSILGLKGSPPNYTLKGIIKSCVVKEEKFYSCIYEDLPKRKWIMSDGYMKKYVDSPLVYCVGDVVMLFYSSLN